MKIKKFVMILVSFLLVFSFYVMSENGASEIKKLINNESFGDSFRISLKRQYELGSNFNYNDYVFIYSCGGGAICGNVFDSKEKIVIDFPSEFLIDSQDGDFNLDYNLGSNKICFTGKSAFNGEFYDDKCYELVSGSLIPQVIF